MFGFKILFLRVIPFITLICFVAFGITILFGIDNITYLSTKTLNGQTYYVFDFEHYFSNIDIDILKTAFNSIIDFDVFDEIIENWEELWENGYDVGDLTMSVINGFTMIIDGIIVIINIILLIPKIIAGIILTALSICGINIDNDQSIILNTLRYFLNIFSLPMIPAM